MVRERKSRQIDIDKLHDLIDSASLPKGKTLTPYEEKKLESLRKQLSDEPAPPPKKTSSPAEIHGKLDNLQPQVQVRSSKDAEKKDERLIQIDLAPRETKKRLEPLRLEVTASSNDFFANEPLFEVEKVDFRESESHPIDTEGNQDGSEPDERPDSRTPRGGQSDDDLPEWIPVTRKVHKGETQHRNKGRGVNASLPEFTYIEEKPGVLPIRHADVPVAFEKVIPGPPQQARSEPQNIGREELKRKKDEEKIARREAKRLAKEQKKKLKLKAREAKRKQVEEQKLMKAEAKKAAVETEEKRREEQRLMKEREDQSHREQQEQQRKEKEQLRQKYIEERQAKQEERGKELEAKRLAKEHDRQRQLEHLELEKKLREEQKLKDAEKRKAAIEAKEKEQEELRLMKEREEKIRLERKALQKKEKDEQSRRKATTKTMAVPFVPRTGDIPTITQEAIEAHPIEVGYEEPMTISPLAPLNREAPVDQPFERPVVEEETPAPRLDKSMVKEQNRQQKRLEKERKQKERLERKELKRKEKERSVQERLEEKRRAQLFMVTKENKGMLKQRKLEERRTQIEELEVKKREDEERRRNDQILEAKEIELRRQHKEEQRLKHLEYKKEKKRLSELGVGTAKDAGVMHDRKMAEDQQHTKELVRIAAEEKERRETKALERKMKKEQRKREKEEHKKKIAEEMKARKNLELNFEEEKLRENRSGQTEQKERNDPFVGFDSIDKETAFLLSEYGYTSVEKLRQATVKDLVKIGVRKKNAQLILAESEEFVEWQVVDDDQQSMRI